jgi:hypothetical protein
MLPENRSQRLGDPSRQVVTCVGIITELDMAVSGSQDGTVNVHTIHEGQFVRTLEPVGCNGLDLEVSFLAMSAQGHIAFAANNKVQSPKDAILRDARSTWMDFFQRLCCL